MTVKELMSWLSKFDPEAEINFSFGRNRLYRKTCAKLVLDDDRTPGNDGCGCLTNMRISSIEQKTYPEIGSSELEFHLFQFFYTDELFEELTKKFKQENEKA